VVLHGEVEDGEDEDNDESDKEGEEVNGLFDGRFTFLCTKSKLFLGERLNDLS
jgi:hypothetical protein